MSTDSVINEEEILAQNSEIEEEMNNIKEEPKAKQSHSTEEETLGEKAKRITGLALGFGSAGFMAMGIIELGHTLAVTLASYASMKMSVMILILLCAGMALHSVSTYMMTGAFI